MGHQIGRSGRRWLLHKHTHKGHGQFHPTHNTYSSLPMFSVHAPIYWELSAQKPDLNKLSGHEEECSTWDWKVESLSLSSSQTKDYKNGTHCLLAWHSAKRGWTGIKLPNGSQLRLFAVHHSPSGRVKHGKQICMTTNGTLVRCPQRRRRGRGNFFNDTK